LGNWEEGVRRSYKHLEKEGWIRQFVADGPLAKDAVEVYKLLGFEVLLNPPTLPHTKKCSPSASRESQGSWPIVYIRAKKVTGRRGRVK
jgi:hypothetical protein